MTLTVTNVRAEITARLSTISGYEVKEDFFSRYVSEKPTKLILVQSFRQSPPEIKPNTYMTTRTFIVLVAVPYSERAQDDLDAAHHAVLKALFSKDRLHNLNGMAVSVTIPDETDFDPPDGGENWSLAAIPVAVKYTQTYEE